jgi:hypothetical protein
MHTKEARHFCKNEDKDILYDLYVDINAVAAV